MKFLRSFFDLFQAKLGRATWARKDQLPADNENPFLIVPAFAVSKSHSFNVELQERLQAALQTRYAKNLQNVCGEDGHGTTEAANCKIVYAPPKPEKTE